MSNHPLVHAYILIFEAAPDGGVIVLNKDELARRFLAKALETHPDRTQDTNRSRAELTEKFRELEAAFKLLSTVLGREDQVWVSAVAGDADKETLERLPRAELTRRRPRRGWQARPTPKLLERDVTDLASMIRSAAEQRRMRDQSAMRIDATLPVTATADLPAKAKTETASDKRFMLGRYLLKAGQITLRQLVDAVLWQRAQRPRVGEIAEEWGIMTKAEVFFVLREKNIDEMFCDVAVRLGFLTSFQRLAILARQRRLQSPIGRFFVERGILDESTIDEAAKEAKRQARAHAADAPSEPSGSTAPDFGR